MRYFVAVADALSFTKGAQNLRLAQPSLTRQIKNLEDELGVSLLIRGGRRIGLTPEGRQFLSDAKRVLALCAESVKAVREMGGEGACELNIGYTATSHFDLLPVTLEAFRKLRADVTVNLFDMDRGEQFQALKSHKIDVGFVGLRPLPAHELSSVGVAEDLLLVALPSDHAMAKHSSVKLAQLASQFFIGMSPQTDPCSREWLLDICQEAGFTASILQEAETEAAAIRFVALGLGVAFVLSGTEQSPEGVTILPVSPPLRRESVIAWRRDDLSKPLRDYVKIVTEHSAR